MGGGAGRAGSGGLPNMPVITAPSHSSPNVPELANMGGDASLQSSQQGSMHKAVSDNVLSYLGAAGPAGVPSPGGDSGLPDK